MGEVNDKNCMMDKSFIIKLFLEQSLERIKLFFLGKLILMEQPRIDSSNSWGRNPDPFDLSPRMSNLNHHPNTCILLYQAQEDFRGSDETLTYQPYTSL